MTDDEVMKRLNDLAKAQGRFLGKAFWEIPRQPGSKFGTSVSFVALLPSQAMMLAVILKAKAEEALASS